MQTLCQLLGKTRQAFYEATWRAEQDSMQEVVVVEQIKEIRKDLPRVGTSKLHFMLTDFLAQHQIKLGRDKLYSLLKENHLLYRKNKNRMKTTQSPHRYYKFPNLVKELKPSVPNALWVSDITYIPGDYFSYLSLITDAYSRKIVGWSLQANLQATGVLEALKMAIKELSPSVTGLIHHSDRGIQYCCRDYISLLESAKIRISMTENSDPGENALAERVNGILKEELLENRRFTSFALAHQAITKAVSTYNHLRPHSSCDYLTPGQAHGQKGELRKRWRVKNQSKENIPEVASQKYPAKNQSP